MIEITVEGGVIQDISGIPSGQEVVVFDYDVEGVDESLLKTDDDGNDYLESVYIGI